LCSKELRHPGREHDSPVAVIAAGAFVYGFGIVAEAFEQASADCAWGVRSCQQRVDLALALFVLVSVHRAVLSVFSFEDG
jgi:hypothetical protein